MFIFILNFHLDIPWIAKLAKVPMKLFFKTQAEMVNLENLANMSNLPNSVKIKNRLNISKFKFLIFISFWNILSLN